MRSQWRWRIAGACAAMAVTILGCESKPPPSEPASESTASSKQDDLASVSEFLREQANPQPQQPAADALPPGHPPIPSESGAVNAPPSAAPQAALKFDAPENWKPERPANTMRVAQYVIPRVEGDSEDGQFVVFFFGVGGGGGTQANLDRWRSQFTTEDGQPVPDSAVVSEVIQVGDIKVTLLDIAGSYSATAMMPGAATGPAKPNQRMLAAVAEFDQGPYFIRATGPTATISANREAFMKLIQSLRH